jgi:hypothetical protein
LKLRKKRGFLKTGFKSFFQNTKILNNVINVKDNLNKIA